MREETKLKIGELSYRLARLKTFTREDIDLVSKNNFMQVIKKNDAVEQVGRGVYQWKAKVTPQLINELSNSYYHLCGWYNAITKRNGK